MRAPKATLVLTLALVAATLGVAVAGLASPPLAAAAPRSFFGIVPQTSIDDAEAAVMRRARIGTMRAPLAWSGVQSSPRDGYHWGGFDDLVATAARQRIRILPFVYSSPDWIAGDYTRLPVNNARQRRAWSAFLRAAVERYGPHGEYWREHNVRSDDYVPKVPINEWQIWNEANFFYFARPASPFRYARLVKISDRAMRRADPSARLILSGLFGEPNARPPNGMDADRFLDLLYRVPGIRASFDGVALHPYSEDAGDLRRLLESMRRVTIDNRDPRVPLYVTEVGWGSANNPHVVSFEQGVRFQIVQMRRAYRYMERNRRRLHLRSVYWFTWQDISGSCAFCDSTGFFRDFDERLLPKRAWFAFTRITGGRAGPLTGIVPGS